jgi:hypothetical protein
MRRMPGGRRVVSWIAVGLPNAGLTSLQRASESQVHRQQQQRAVGAVHLADQLAGGRVHVGRLDGEERAGAPVGRPASSWSRSSRPRRRRAPGSRRRRGRWRRPAASAIGSRRRSRPRGPAVASARDRRARAGPLYLRRPQPVLRTSAGPGGRAGAYLRTERRAQPGRSWRSCAGGRVAHALSSIGAHRRIVLEVRTDRSDPRPGATGLVPSKGPAGSLLRDSRFFARGRRSPGQPTGGDLSCPRARPRLALGPIGDPGASWRSWPPPRRVAGRRLSIPALRKSRYTLESVTLTGSSGASGIPRDRRLRPS